MSDILTLKKQLKIKAGSSKRLLKERNMYRKELEDQTTLVNKLVAEGIDESEWEVKNGRRMLLESDIVLADSEVRVAKATDDLRAVVTEGKKNPELAQDEDFLRAEETLGLSDL